MNGPAISSAALWRIFFLLLVNAVLFSVLGGALLTRYLLPMYPLVLVVAVSTFYRRVPYWHGLAAVFSGGVCGRVCSSIRPIGLRRKTTWSMRG